MKSKQNRISLYMVMQMLLCVGLVLFTYAFLFRGSAAFGLQGAEIDSTKTAIAGTMQALMGPFPTATQPTATASPTATATLRISATPSRTPTLTPTKTPTRALFSATPPPRDFVPDSISQFIPANTSVPVQPSKTAQPTSVPTKAPTKILTPIPTAIPTLPTAPPTDPPTEPPPTEPSPTDPPTEPPPTEPPPTDPPTEPPTEPPPTEPPAPTEPPVVP